MPETLKSLEEVDDFFGDERPLPHIAVSVPRFEAWRILAQSVVESVRETDNETPSVPKSAAGGELEEGSIREIGHELQRTWQSIRRGGRPQSVLHALILRDSLPVTRLAATLMMDVTEVEANLVPLVGAGIVQPESNAEGFVSYSVIGLVNPSTAAPESD